MLYLWNKVYIMIVENTTIVSTDQYAKAVNKTISIINRYIRQGRELPGIKEIWKISDRIVVLKKGRNYESEVARVSKSKYLFAEN